MAETTLAGYEELEHTADWSLRVWAPDLAGLLEQAVRGMNDLSGIQAQPSGRVQRTVTTQSNDAEGLLVSFLTEILHYAERENIAFDEFDLQVSETQVTARLNGAPIAERKKEIKAVTYHNLVIREMHRGLEAEIVFDV